MGHDVGCPEKLSLIPYWSTAYRHYVYGAPPKKKWPSLCIRHVFMSSSEKQTSESSILQSNISAWILLAVEKNSGRQGTAISPPKPGGLPSTYPDFACNSQKLGCKISPKTSQDIPIHPSGCRTLGCRPKAFWAGQLQASVTEGHPKQRHQLTHPAKRGHRTWWCLRSNRPGPWLVTKGVFVVSDTQIEVHTHRPRGDKPMSFPFGIIVQAGPSEIVVLDSGQMKIEKLGKASENNFWLLQVAWLWKGYR